MANPLSLATVNHIRAGLGIAYVSRVQQDLVLDAAVRSMSYLIASTSPATNSSARMAIVSRSRIDAFRIK